MDAVVIPLLATTVDEACGGSDDYGATFALADLFASTGNLVGPLVGGVLATHLGTATLYLLVCGLAALTLPVLLYGLLRRQCREGPSRSNAAGYKLIAVSRVASPAFTSQESLLSSDDSIAS